MSSIFDFCPLWGTWVIEKNSKPLGKGSYGTVWKAHRKDAVTGDVFYSAIKHISIPQDEREIAALMEESVLSDKQSAEKYYSTILESLVQEIKTMYSLRGHTNIVSYEDHIIIPKKDMVGYDLFIRMELLKSLPVRLKEGSFQRSDVIKLGMDISKAIEVLNARNYVHRDIKPQNIFVNDMGDYKLGDYGTARMLDASTIAMTKRGTYAYMAPEVYKSEQANNTVDIYSLGIVMYRLMNGNRLPFLSATAESITSTDSETALIKRIRGDRLPSPAYADANLSKVILKACAYSASDRYQSGLELYDALNALLKDDDDQDSDEVTITDPEYSKRETDYTKALQLLKEEKYDVAIECFIQLGDYLDSQKKLEEARSKAEKEKQYNNAILMLEQGKYYESAVAFKALDDYKDSAARAEEASAKDRLEKAYKNADGLFASKKYGDAAKAFQALNDYKDSAEKAKLALDRDRQKRHKGAIISLCGVVAFIAVVFAVIKLNSPKPIIDSPVTASPETAVVTVVEETPPVEDVIPAEEATPEDVELLTETEASKENAESSEEAIKEDGRQIEEEVAAVEETLGGNVSPTENMTPIADEAAVEDLTATENEVVAEEEAPTESGTETVDMEPSEGIMSSEVVPSTEDRNSSEVVLPPENVDSSEADVPVEPMDTAITTQEVEPGVIFNNPQIEDSVRAALNKPQGELFEGDLSSVKKLHITGKDLTDISDLAKLTGLTEVCLSNNKISDISSLAGLAGLKELVLNNNSISDITVLKGLPNLETLNLSSNEISDVSPLIGLRKLKKLYLNRNERLVDVSMLSDLALDVYVGPSMSPVVTFENHTIEVAIRAALHMKEDEMIREEDLSRVKSLDLSRTGITSIDELTKLSSLESLTLADNEIEDIYILGSLSDLKVLVLKNNHIEDISALESLKNLITLDLSENAVSDISALSEMKDMKNLYLSSNQITDIAPLSNLKAIEVLHIDGVSEDIDLARLSGMRNLKEYKGPEVKWPVDKDATIVGLWSSSVKDIAISKIAFGDAFATGGITKTGSIEVSNEKAIEYLNGCIEGTIQSEVEIDGICLFPYEGIDYTESLAKAVVNGVAIHIMSADEPEDIYDEICDMVGVTSHGTWQRYLDWPTDKDATIVGLWSEDIEDTTAAKAAFADAFMAACVNRTGSIDASKEKAIEYLDGCIEGTIQQDLKIEGICLFPYEDLDYSESIAKAIVNGVSIHIMSAKEPEGIFKEICSMYDINEMYQYRSTVEWPIDKEAVIVTVYTESAAVSDELMNAIEQASIAVGYDRTIGRLIATEDQSAKYLEFCIDGGNNGTDAINAVYLFPYEGVDYSSVLRKADQKGIAVYLFSSEDPEDVFDEICKLYNRRDIINPFSNAGEAVG